METTVTNKTLEKLKYDLVRAGLVAYETIEQAQEIANAQNINIGQALINSGVLTEDAILKFLEAKLHIPYVNLDDYTLDSTQHEIVFEYVDQNTPIIEVTKNLTNKEKIPENPGTPGNPGSNPKTGDDTNLWLPIALMLAAGSMVAGILFGSRKKKKLNKKED